MRNPLAKKTSMALVASFLLCLALAFGATAQAAAPRQGVATPKGVYWGAWIGSQLTGTEAPWDMNATQAFQRKVGKSLSLIQLSAPFETCGSGCKPQEFPAGGMDLVRNYGAIPILGWGSQPSTAPQKAPAYQLRRIANGSMDSYLRSFATEAKNWGHPFFMRFNWEMNGTWFLWAAGRNNNTAKDFVAAWRHVHDVFAEVGATNATWTWCPYVDPKGNRTPIESLYPGNKYVDWTCLDGYNWGDTPVNPSPWASFDRLFGSSYQSIKKLAPGKPMMIGEIATNGSGKRRSRWIREMFKLLPTKYPLVRALVWYDQIDRGVKWPLESSPPSLRAFKNGIKSPRYLGNSFGSLEGGPIRPPARRG